MGSALLEVEEPALAGGVFDPCALVGAVDVAGALGDDETLLVGAFDVAGAEDCLLAGGDSADGDEDLIPAFALVELGAFEGGELFGVLGDAFAGVEKVEAVGRHVVQDEGPAPRREWTSQASPLSSQKGQGSS